MKVYVTTPRGDALAVATLDYLREHPDHWNQKEFFDQDGRTCFAGRAVLIGLGLPDEEAFRVYQEEYHETHDADLATWEIAADLLGWDVEQANEGVFYLLTRDIRDLEAVVRGMMHGQ